MLATGYLGYPNRKYRIFKKFVSRMKSLGGIIVCILFSTLALCQEKKTAAYYYEKGELALNRKEYITANAHFTECIRLNPLFADAYRARAIVREHLGENAKALTDYNVYVDLNPLDAEALFSRAVLRFDAKQFLLARQDFLNLLTLPKGETNTVYFAQEQFDDSKGKILTAQRNTKDHIYNYLGLIETTIPRYDKAIEWLDSAIKVAPDNPSYWVNRGIARQGKKDNAGAVADYNQALVLDPENSLALHNMADLQTQLGNKDTSEKLIDASIEKNKNLPYPRAERAYQRLQKGDLKGALEDYDEVVKLEPKNPDNYINRGIVKEKLKDLPGAAIDFAKAIELDEKNQKAWMEHGNIMTKEKKWKEALEDYDVAIKLEPKYGLAYYNRAIVHQSTGQNKPACDDIKSAEKLGVKIDPRLREKVCK